MRFLLFVSLSFFVTACSHQMPQKAVQDESILILPNGHYNLQTPVTSGKVSQYERKIIIPGGPDDSTLSPCAKNFDGIMDNLEGLMSRQIEENNKIAAQQAAAYSY